MFADGIVEETYIDLDYIKMGGGERSRRDWMSQPEKTVHGCQI